MPYKDPEKRREAARLGMKKIRMTKTQTTIVHVNRKTGGKCVLCGKISEDLVSDHNHQTRLARGRICQSCNVRLGYIDKFAMDIGTQKLLEYLLGGLGVELDASE